MNFASSSFDQIFLLYLNVQNTEYYTHVIKVDTNLLTVTLINITLPKFTPAPLPDSYVSLANINGDGNYFLGISHQGASINTNNAGGIISLSQTLVTASLLTNMQTLSCQCIDPLNPIIPPMGDLIQTGLYTFTIIPSPPP